MGKGNYSRIIDILLKLNSDAELKGKLIVVGGIVPYLIAGEMSEREHSDLDIVVDISNMNGVREYLKEQNLYDKVLDSIELSFNENKEDYGLNSIIDGITINFAPCITDEKCLIQRNFLTRKDNGFNALVDVNMYDVRLEELLTKTIVEEIEVKSYSLEVVKIMKEKSNKKKDTMDIAIIDEFGYDEKNYINLKNKLANMEFKINPKSKVLKKLLR